MPSDSADFVPAGAQERLLAPILRLALRLALRPALSPQVSIAVQRRWLETMSGATRPTRRVEIQSGTVGDVAGDWLRPRASLSSAAIAYLHGGGYCIGSPATHRALTSRLARASGLPVFAAAYRLAPEHPFPAAIEDAVAAYRGLIESGPVVIAGDSAGGGLALATALALRERQIRAPAALILFSPWVDLTPPANSTPAPKGETVLSSAMLNVCASHYLAGQDAAAPMASPIYADLRGLPPTLIQAGTGEMLHGRAIRLHDALRDAGAAVRCEIVPGRWHVFQLHAGMLPSADAAIARAAEFMLRNIAA
jgi:acetyl esterase/lipase